MFKNETHNHQQKWALWWGCDLYRRSHSWSAFWPLLCLSGYADFRCGRYYSNRLLKRGPASPQQVISKTVQRMAILLWNQIGLATTYTQHFHPGFSCWWSLVENGAALMKRRPWKPAAGDVSSCWEARRVVMVVGGATGSSKVQTAAFVDGRAEVQKGDAIEERKIQRSSAMATWLVSSRNPMTLGPAKSVWLLVNSAFWLEIDLTRRTAQIPSDLMEQKSRFLSRRSGWCRPAHEAAHEKRTKIAVPSCR